MPTSHATRIALSVLIWLAAASAGEACPFCDGGADGVNEVKQEIFAAHFWPNVLRVALPFPIVAGLIAALHFGFGPERVAPPDAAAAPESLPEATHD